VRWIKITIIEDNHDARNFLKEELVSYKVGIEDPFYFSKCFKKQFGVSPSAYAQGKIQINC